MPLSLKRERGRLRLPLEHAHTLAVWGGVCPGHGRSSVDWDLASSWLLFLGQLGPVTHALCSDQHLPSLLQSLFGFPVEFYYLGPFALWTVSLR